MLSPELTEEYANIRGLHTFQIPLEPQPLLVNVTLHVQNGSIEEILKKITDLIDNPEVVPPPFRGMISAKAEGSDRICLGFAVPLPPLPSEVAALLAGDTVSKLQEELKVDQSTEFNLRFATSFSDVLRPGAEPLVMQLL